MRLTDSSKTGRTCALMKKCVLIRKVRLTTRVYGMYMVYGTDQYVTTVYVHKPNKDWYFVHNDKHAHVVHVYMCHNHMHIHVHVRY